MTRQLLKYALAGLLLTIGQALSAESMPRPPSGPSPEIPDMLGPINFIDKQRIVLMDMEFRLSPTVKVYSAKGKRVSLDKLRPGDTVGLKLLRLDRKTLVDSIRLLDLSADGPDGLLYPGGSQK